MDSTRIWNCTKSFGLALGITSVLSALLVVAKETNPKTVMFWMNWLTGHHWVTHGTVALVLFGLLGWLFSRGFAARLSGARVITVLVAGVVSGSLIIVGFYLVAD